VLICYCCSVNASTGDNAQSGVETITVPLTQGKVAIIDACDAWVLEWKWFAHKKRDAWYAERTDNSRERQRTVLLHRIILVADTGVDFPGMLADHRNGNSLDNRRSNLRWSDYSESGRNRGKPRNNKSGIMGISWDNVHSKWRAQIQHHGHKVYIGRFTTIEAAAAARLEAAKRIHGEFASEVSRGLTPTQ
jgi:HNH endonuclease/AP2 domain